MVQNGAPGQSTGNPTPTTSANNGLDLTRPPPGSSESDDANRRAILGICEQVKRNFQNNLTQAENLSRASEGNDGEADSASVNAHKMNGLTLAIEGLLRDPYALFRDFIISRAEAHASAADPGEVEVDSAVTTPIEIETPELLECVFLEPLSSLNNSIIDIAHKATPSRYRFVDCSSLVHHLDLRVIEYASLDDVSFAATSYIWRGVVGPSIEGMSKWGSFAVAKATDGDPISIDVLLHIARACLIDKIPLLWLDRLCIIQSSKDDKAWQIQRMYNLYASCQKCYVLPGGTRRLASLEEPTMWIHRGWTLQEAVAPEKCSVVISWAHTGGTFDNPKQRMGTTGSIDIIIPGLSAQVPLRPLLRASISRNASFRVRCTESLTGREVDVNLIMFGEKEGELRHPAALASAMRVVENQINFHGTQKNTALWRSAMMRTSSRPVDMVFSIMGLFGVTLNPKAFDAADRLGATIALARGILEKGGSPNWLTSSLKLPPHPSIRSFPAFPRTRVDGLAMYTIPDVVGFREVEAASLMTDIDGWIGTEDINGATMDDAGYLTFKANSIPIEWTGEIQPVTNHKRGSSAYEDQLLRFHPANDAQDYLVSHDNKIWRKKATESNVARTGNDPIGTYAVALGRMFTETSTRFFDPQMLVRAVILEEYMDGKFSRPMNGSWFTFNRLSFHVDRWEERTFVI